jgi:hypothetical protein
MLLKEARMIPARGYAAWLARGDAPALRRCSERALQFDALDGAGQGAHQNPLAFLKTQHKM